MEATLRQSFVWVDVGGSEKTCRFGISAANIIEFSPETLANRTIFSAVDIL